MSELVLDVLLIGNLLVKLVTKSVVIQLVLAEVIVLPINDLMGLRQLCS